MSIRKTHIANSVELAENMIYKNSANTNISANFMHGNMPYTLNIGDKFIKEIQYGITEVPNESDSHIAFNNKIKECEDALGVQWEKFDIINYHNIPTRTSHKYNKSVRISKFGHMLAESAPVINICIEKFRQPIGFIGHGYIGKYPVSLLRVPSTTKNKTLFQYEFPKGRLRRIRFYRIFKSTSKDFRLNQVKLWYAFATHLKNDDTIPEKAKLAFYKIRMEKL